MGRDKIELFSMDEAKLFKYLMFEKMLRHFDVCIFNWLFGNYIIVLDCLNYI